MTREELREDIEALYGQGDISYYVYSRLIDGVDTLEQEPCDAISRQGTIERIKEKAKHIKNEDTLNGLCGAVSILFDMPSVMRTSEDKFGTNETRM